MFSGGVVLQLSLWSMRWDDKAYLAVIAILGTRHSFPEAHLLDYPPRWSEGVVGVMLKADFGMLNAVQTGMIHAG